MRYYILWCSEGGGRTRLTTYNKELQPMPLSNAIEVIDMFNRLRSLNRYFLVDEEHYNRWWREYLS